LASQSLTAFSLAVDDTGARRYRSCMAKTTTPRGKTKRSQIVTASDFSRPVEQLIHVIRGQKVMIDSDLAALYGVPTKALKQAVRRNMERFPEDFAFQLSKAEMENWRSQIVTSNPSARMSLRVQPFAFTQEGVAMLSAVLRSDRAIEMSIAIVRTFIRMRELMAANKDIAARVEKLERRHDRTASVIEVLVEDIDRLAHEVKGMKRLPPVSKRKIGFKLDKS
jgi:phage regulator Rha-like protein